MGYRAFRCGEMFIVTERKQKIQLVPGGPSVDAVEVSVDESSEKWSEYKLSDGSRIRLKQVLMEVSRVDGTFDQEGNPLYVIKAQPVMAVVEVKDKLKRKVN